MAAEVPVKDVLCEAMEYLSKLGSNLRTRTENLREKKIKKDKLNNALALQKTASKVLLICELSKKSLENVETGVRKILERVDTSQAALPDIGGNSSTTDKKRSHSEKHHYYSFEYKSRKLRIKKKVNVKHYMSVKVFAKKMPTSMLEKYPVYHDCKLFRIRNKRDQRARLDSESNDRAKSNNKHQLDAFVSEDRTQVKSENKEKRDSDKSECQPSKSHFRDRTKSRSNSKQIENSPNKNRDKRRSEESHTKSKEHRSSMDSEDEKCNKQINKHKENDSSDSSDTVQKSKTSQKKEIKKKRVIIESSEEDEKSNKDTSKSKPVSDDEISCAIDKVKSLKKKDKDIEQNINSENKDVNDPKVDETDKQHRQLEVDSDVNDHHVGTTKEQHSQLDDSNHSVQEPELKKRKLLGSPNDEEPQNDENNEVVTLDSSDENRDSPVKNNVPEKADNDKPLIKLVSLSKLLKPDILQNSELVDNKTKDENSKSTKVGKRSFQMKKKRMEKEEKEYWMDKRKEVKAFKPKKFTINVARLPTLSKHYLEVQQLKRVLQNGKTICEIHDENQPEQSEKEQPVLSNDELVTETNKVKSSLLNESESDCQINEEATKVKDALLKDSDSDSFGNKDLGSTNEKENTALENKRAKDSLFNNSDSDSNQKKTTDENEQAKQKVMGSDSDNRENESENSIKNNETIAYDVESKTNDIEGDREKDQNDNSNENLGLKCSSAGDENKGDNDKVNINQSPLNKSEEKDAKESLLNNSSDDKTSTPLKQRRETKSVTPQSKKKHIREIVHAKKMLLTYSSSSETDDEQLRSVIKEIKDSLLKEISDDETKKQESPEKDLKSDSDEEDVIKEIEKKKELKKKEKHKREKHKRSKDGGKDSSDEGRSSSRRKVRFNI